ncbi:MAG: 50S ribosomal protein L9 [Rickettsiaceae bacterium]|nr:50S ribosomal protein L9 [Rickettsiaceae bacterium]
MQVILVKSVRKLGKVGETVDVANGYGRNYLIPQNLAIRATNDNLEKFASLQKDLEAKNVESKKLAEKAAKAIDGKHLDFITQSAADGRLFGSVSLKALAAKVSKIADLELNYSNILLDSPIKFNGVYNVQIILHPEVTASVLVVVAKTESEAKDALIEFKEGGAKAEEEAKEAQLQAIAEETYKERLKAEEQEENAAAEAIANS